LKMKNKTEAEYWDEYLSTDNVSKRYNIMQQIIKEQVTKKIYIMDNITPKKGFYALIRIWDTNIKQLEVSPSLEDLLEKQKAPILDASLYVIDHNTKFMHKLTLNQSLDLKALSSAINS